uniref:Uncharacterized protein n=1 Tax=Arundo donax TaxID=35708 RepID=A0A0A9C6H7_ARUDO
MEAPVFKVSLAPCLFLLIYVSCYLFPLFSLSS